MKKLLVICLFFQFITAATFAQQYKYHTVQDGETVYSIAEKYNTSEETIFKYNPDAKRGIQPGSKLVVPIAEKISAENIEFKTHRVKRKETLYSLSEKYQVSIDDIKRYNKHLYAEELQRGEKIRIPLNVPKATSFPERIEKKVPGVNPLRLTNKEHVVLPKETKFGISQKYNISVEELERLNPQMQVLHPGMVLKVSSEETALKRDEKLFRYYQVKPQETLFSLTRRFGISKDSLIVLNPALANGLESGMVLKIPNREPFGPKEYSEENIINLEERITNHDTKNLVLMLPFNSHKIVSTDTSTTTKERIKRDQVMQIALDFYSGVLMAVDSAKTLGLSTQLQVFDTEQSSARINNIIDDNNFQNVDAVIGPLIQAHAETAAAGLQREGIPVVSPLTKKETQYLDNFYQTRPSDEMLENAMLSFLSENTQGKNVVIIADASSGAIKSKLLQLVPNATIVNPREGSYVNQEQLTAALVKGTSNWVILESNKINIISNATSYLSSLADEFDITLFTTHKNNSFENDNVSSWHLSRLHFHFPSVDKEYNEKSAKTFVSAYKKKYGVVPNTYAVRGFDVTYDMLLRLAAADNLAKSVEIEGTTEYVENKFDYEKKPSGGYYNKAIYIMAYDDNLQLKEVKKDDFKSNLFGQFKD